MLSPVPPTQNLNQVSGVKLYLILAALLSAVFLGALDGEKCPVTRLVYLGFDFMRQEPLWQLSSSQ